MGIDFSCNARGNDPLNMHVDILMTLSLLLSQCKETDHDSDSDDWVNGDGIDDVERWDTRVHIICEKYELDEVVKKAFEDLCKLCRKGDSKGATDDVNKVLK